MSTDLRVACLGAGYFARFHHDAWHRLERCSLVGVCDTNVQRASESAAAAFTDIETMLGSVSPDILDIITPPYTHADAIATAIDHGVKVIICQKPFCETFAQAEATVKQAELADVLLVVHENFRFQPWFRQIRQALDDHALGDLHQACFRLRTGDGQGPDAYLERQPYFQTMQRLLMHETGVHYIDTFRYLFGEACAVYADLKKRNPVIAGEDAGLVVFDFPNQLQATFDGNRHLDFAVKNTRLTFGDFCIEGSRGTLSLFGDGQVVHREHGKLLTRVLLDSKSWPGFAGDCVHALQQHVVSHLLDGSTIENAARDYLQVLRLERIVYESDAQSRKLLIDLKEAVRD